MNAPLPATAFPVGGKAGGAGVFVVAVLVGLALYMSAKASPNKLSVIR